MTDPKEPKEARRLPECPNYVAHPQAVWFNEHWRPVINSLQEENRRLAEEFKNFHRLICAAIDKPNYHDEVDWRRDQASLVNLVTADNIERAELTKENKRLTEELSKHSQLPNHLHELVRSRNEVLERLNVELTKKLEATEADAHEYKREWESAVEREQYRTEELQSARAEIIRLHRVIAKELSENDELGCEYTYVNALRAELTQAQESLKLAEQDRDSWKQSFLTQQEAANGLIDKQNESLKLLREALEKAESIIHSEFCGDRHHHFCIQMTEALAASGDKTNG